MSSSSSVVEISRSKRRYHDQDALLKSYIGFGDYTAKEIAVEILDWKYEQYANSPKRAFDLFKLGYLEQLDSRECRQTGKAAHTYRITEKGMAHLRKNNLISGSSAGAVIDAQSNSKQAAVNVKQHFSDLKTLLGG